jgi:hypothetical protein
MTYIPSRHRWMTSVLGVLLAMAASTMPAHASGRIIGALEIGPRYSAIHTVSEATGDPVAYIVRNDSAAGRRILAACLEPLFCQVEVLRSQQNTAGQDMGFKEGASGWMEILDAVFARMDSGVEWLNQADTRFGSLTIKGGDQLQWRGNTVFAAAPGGRMALVESYELGDAATGSDVLVVQTTTTGPCKRLLNLVVVTSKGATVSERLGSCSDIFRVVQDYKLPVLTIHTVGDQPVVSPQGRVYWNRETYVFQNGKLRRQVAK